MNCNTKHSSWRENGCLLLFCLLVPFTSTQAQNEMKGETYPVVASKAIKNFHIEPGVYDLSFAMTDQEEWNMAISIPEIISQENVPLVIALHWAGDGQAYQQLRRSAERKSAKNTIRNV